MSDDLLVRLRSTIDRLTRQSWNAGYTEACVDYEQMPPRQLEIANNAYDEAEARFEQIMAELAAERSVLQ